MGDNRDGIRWCHKRAGPIDHIPITVTIASSSKLNAVPLDSVNERMSISQVGIGVSSTEVREWSTILNGGLGKAEERDKNFTGIRARDAMQTVE